MARRFSRLTRPTIRALSTSEKITEHGITAERTKAGDIRYSVNIMVDGQRIHRVVGRESEGVGRTQAEEYVALARTKAREGRLELPQGRKLHRSFVELAYGYLKRLEASGGKDMANKRRHIEQQLKPYFRNRRADQISDFLVQKYVSQRLPNAKQATVNRELSTLSHMLNRAVEWKWIKAEQKPRIAKGHEPRKSIEVLSPGEMAALRAGAVGDQNNRTWLFVEFGLNTAMRHDEIVSARYDQVDFEKHRLFVPNAKANEREQPLTPGLVEQLRQQSVMEDDPNSWIFPSARASTGHARDMDRQFRRAVIRAGLNPEKVTPHVMRHTAITRLVMAGVDIPTIQKISGHKTVAMVMHYFHVYGQHIDKAAAILDTGKLDALTPNLHEPEISNDGTTLPSAEIYRINSA